MPRSKQSIPYIRAAATGGFTAARCQSGLILCSRMIFIHWAVSRPMRQLRVARRTGVLQALAPRVESPALVILVE